AVGSAHVRVVNMALMREFWSLLTPAQRRQAVGAQFLSLAMALLTVVGIASITPFFAVLGDPALVERSPALVWLSHRFEFQNTRAFVAVLGLGFVVMVVTANLINFLGTNALLRLAYRIGDDFRNALFTDYLHRDFIFHARTSASELFTNITTETARIAAGILQSFFVLVANAVTASLIIVCMLLLNPLAALVVLVALVGGYLLIYAKVRRWLLRAG